MTKQEALKIREWRDKGATWRRVASNAAEEWPNKNYLSGNQIEGMDLCTAAAKLLKESPSKEPWN